MGTMRDFPAPLATLTMDHALSPFARLCLRASSRRPTPYIRFCEAAADASSKSKFCDLHCDKQTSVYLLQVIVAC